MTTTIRTLQEADLPAASKLVRRVFDQFEGPDYTADGCAAFDRFTDPKTMAGRLHDEEMFIWGAFREDKLVGVLATRGAAHISLLFVEACCHRQGIARTLFDLLRDTCSANPAIRRITVNSSPFAVGIYLRLRFSPTDAECTQDGIRFTPMEYLIR